MKSYAGIGARATPFDILDLMTDAATELERVGLVLRSGGASGADSAFEAGVIQDQNKEIYLPWSGFNKHGTDGVVYPTAIQESKAMRVAADHHPNWRALKPHVRALMTRNTFQILGRNVDDPVLFVLCWTEGGKGLGGTGQALRIAKTYDIPIFDLGGMKLSEIQNGINQIIEKELA